VEATSRPGTRRSRVYRASPEGDRDVPCAGGPDSRLPALYRRHLGLKGDRDIS